MKITVLDKLTFLPESAVERLQSLADQLEIHNDLPSREETVARLKNCDIAILEWTGVSEDMFEQIGRVKYICLATTGYSHIDITAATKKGIQVSNIPGYSRQSVAEHAFALLLAINRKLILADRAVREGKRDYVEPFLSMELYRKTLGIVGLGNIGSWVAKIGLGFGMRVISCSRIKKHMPDVEDVSIDQLLTTSDVVCCCVDANPSTLSFFNREKFNRMKVGSCFVSITSRKTLDEQALADALAEGRIEGAGLDEVSENSPLLTSPRVVLSPGTGWYTKATLERQITSILANIEAYLNLNPMNLVN